MDIQPLQAEEAAVRRFVEELWLPYHRELEAAVEDHVLAEDVDLVAEEVAYRLDLLATEGHRAWVAVDGADAVPDQDAVADPRAHLVGFVTTEVDASPSVFERPDRLTVGDIYVRPAVRGSGLARDLIERAAERAREEGCPEIALDVDADNARAIAFYEKLGFETARRRMLATVEDL